ncbi:MAG: sugar ABC transporter permease [Chloroflexota bacterium]
MRLSKKTELSLLLLLLPALLFIATFVIFPAGWAVVVSLTNQSLLGPQSTQFQFIGFSNYIRLFQDSQFWNSLGLSVGFVWASALVGQSLLGLFMAILLRPTKLMGKGIIGGSAVLAWIIPEIVTVYIWASVLNFESGSANQILTFLDIEKQRWLIDTPMLALVIVNIWRGTAFSMLLFSAALESIPRTLYEAAAVDGAGGWQKLTRITLPLIRPTILLNSILVSISAFSAFGIIFAMTGGGPLGRSEIISIYIYKNAFEYRDLGYGAAASVIMLLTNLVLALIYIWLLRDGSDDTKRK